MILIKFVGALIAIFVVISLANEGVESPLLDPYLLGVLAFLVLYLWSKQPKEGCGEGNQGKVMFGLFAKKKLHFSCPMCEGDMNTKLNPDGIEDPFEFDSDYDVISGGECPFCKLKVDITIHRKNRAVKAFDPRWEKVICAFDKKEELLQEQECDVQDALDDIDCVLGGGGSSDKINKAGKRRSVLQNKLTAIESKRERLQEAFDKKEDRYTERQMNWREKFDDKFR